MPELVKNVVIGDTWYGPDHGNTSPPADVAEQITNPDCWGTEALEKDTGNHPADVDPDAAPDGNVDDVLAWVHGGEPDGKPADGWQDRALRALDAEAAGKDRKGIVETLTEALEKATGA